MGMKGSRTLQSGIVLKQLTKLAESGCSTAMLRLGELYDKGYRIQGEGCRLTHIDMDKGYRYYRLAYENGEVEAAFYLGLHYLVGAAVEKDLRTASRYLREAAASPNPVISQAAKEIARKNYIIL